MKAKKIIVVSHCVLNQNAVLDGWGRAKGAFPLVHEIIEEGVGIIQLPCPEFLLYGPKREPKTYEEYDFKEYRAHCKKLIPDIVEQIKVYLAHGYIFTGILGIRNSPTCSIAGQRGVLMEELFIALGEIGIQPPFFEVPELYDEQSQEKNLVRELHSFLQT